MVELFLTALFSLLALVNAAVLFLFFLPERRYKKYSPDLSIIVPAHNEEKFLAATIESIRSSRYGGRKEIIIVDDGSSDRTGKIVRSLAKKFRNVRAFSISHSGKSAALNFGIGKAKYGVVAFVDADSTLAPDALQRLAAPLADANVSVSSGIIRARHTKNPLTWMQDIDYISSSGWRYACDKINATYISPGFAAFRKSDLLRSGGFGTSTLTEDLDTTLAMRRRGYGAAMTRALMFTSVPQTLRSFVHQRVRWGRGSVQSAKKHSGVLGRGSVGAYGFPMHLFWYPFSLFYLPFAIYWMLSVFVSSQITLPLAAAIFFIKWVTVYGIADLFYNVFSGNYALTPLLASILLSWSLSFIYLIAAARRFRALSWKMFAYMVIFPYFWITFAVQAYALLYELPRKGGMNVWTKGQK